MKGNELMHVNFGKKIYHKKENKRSVLFLTCNSQIRKKYLINQYKWMYNKFKVLLLQTFCVRAKFSKILSR